MKKLSGSFVTEMSIVFPVIFLALILEMSAGIVSLYALLNSVAAGESLMVAEEALKKGHKEDAAAALAKTYLEERCQVEGVFAEVDVQEDPGFFLSRLFVETSGSSSFLSSLPWHIQQKKMMIDPTVFRNRVDLFLEVVSR